MVARVGGGDLEVVHQSNVTFPRACLTALRCRFLSTRSALAARLGRVGLRLRWSDMGSGDHFRQPAPRVGAVRLLRAEAARGDQQLAARRSRGFRRCVFSRS